MIPVGQLRRAGGLHFTHRRYLRCVKPIGFQVRQTPIGIAEIGFNPVRSGISLNRFGLTARGFQRMAQGKMYRGIIRNFLRTLAVYGQRFIKIANNKILVGVKHFDRRTIGGLHPQQHGLFQCLIKFLSFIEDVDIIHVRAVVIGFQHNRGLKQELRFIERIKLNPYVCQKSDGFNMMAFCLQKMPTNILGLYQAPFLNKASNTL